MSQLSRAKVMESRPRTAAYSTPPSTAGTSVLVWFTTFTGHRATHHILSMGAEHLRQRRLLGPLS